MINHINLTTMIKTTRAQLPKYATRVMVVVNMNMMSTHAIGRKVCLQAKGLYGLSKDPRPKRHPNIWRKDESKKIKDSMKVEGSVHRKKYDGHCTKQWAKISKATWTSPILRKRSMCWTSFNMASLMKDDMNDGVPNGTPKSLIPFDGVVNWDGVLK
jgi:hypothetical protein